MRSSFQEGGGGGCPEGGWRRRGIHSVVLHVSAQWPPHSCHYNGQKLVHQLSCIRLEGSNVDFEHFEDQLMDWSQDWLNYLVTGQRVFGCPNVGKNILITHKYWNIAAVIFLAINKTPQMILSTVSFQVLLHPRTRYILNYYWTLLRFLHNSVTFFFCEKITVPKLDPGRGFGSQKGSIFLIAQLCRNIAFLGKWIFQSTNIFSSSSPWASRTPSSLWTSPPSPRKTPRFSIVD